VGRTSLTIWSMIAAGTSLRSQNQTVRTLLN